MEKIIIFAFVIVLAFCSNGCRSTGTEINRNFIDHSIEIDRSQTIQRELIQRLDRGEEQLGSIAERAELLSGDIGEIIDLFLEYDRSVRRMLSELKSIAVRTVSGERESKNPE